MICRLDCRSDKKSHYHCVCGAIIRSVGNAEVHCNACMFNTKEDANLPLEIACTVCGENIKRNSVETHIRSHKKKKEIASNSEHHIDQNGFLVLGRNPELEDRIRGMNHSSLIL